MRVLGVELDAPDAETDRAAMGLLGRLASRGLEPDVRVAEVGVAGRDEGAALGADPMVGRGEFDPAGHQGRTAAAPLCRRSRIRSAAGFLFHVVLRLRL